jgi:methyl-accepting chemotaxis protein
MRKATAEQATGANQITQALASMRSGAAATAKAVGEQTKASDEIATAMSEINRVMGDIGKAMTEQVTTSEQVGRSVEAIRKQVAQITQAMNEQTRATRDAAAASSNVSKQVKLITVANGGHAAAADRMMKAFAEIRTITGRNAEGAKDARDVTKSIIGRITALDTIASDLVQANSSPAKRQTKRDGRRST